MALSSPVLSNLIKVGILGDPNVVDNESLQRLCDSIASSVVAHIQASAVVLPVLLVAPPTGGPVTGTGSVT